MQSKIKIGTLVEWISLESDTVAEKNIYGMVIGYKPEVRSNVLWGEGPIIVMWFDQLLSYTCKSRLKILQ